MESNEAEETGIATWLVELWVALGLFMLGALVAFKSWQLGAGWREDGPGAGYFPFYIGVLICAACAVIAARSVLSARRDTSIFVTTPQLKLVLTVLLPTVAYVIVVQFVGLYVGSLLFIAGFMVWVGHYSWAKSVAIAMIVTVLTFMMFEVWFKVPLFKGAFNPLRWLGF